MMKNKEGFKLNRKKISMSSREKLLNSFLKVLKVCLKIEDYQKVRDVKSWNNQQLHNVLINLRIKDKDRFSLIYDLMQKNICLSFFCSSNKLPNLAANFLDIKNDWHQDSAYDKLNSIPSNGVILWMPMINTNKKNGTIIIKPKSQNEKNVYKIKQKWKKFVSPQLTVPNSYLKKYKSKDISVKTGDCLAMYPNLFHKSGNNISRQIRFTILARFNKILTRDFTIFGNRI